MSKVYACIDGLATTSAVIDWSVWSALRLNLPLDFLHVLEGPPERPVFSDCSSAIGLGAQESLLHELSVLDAQHSKLAQESARRLLAGARERAEKAGVSRLDARLRYGELLDNVLEVEPDAQLFVLGEHRHANKPSRLHLDHHVEHIIRSVRRAVLVATTEQFQAPKCFVMAFDGSATARQAVQTVARSPLLAGLPVLVAMAGANTPLARRQLEQARCLLVAAGLEAEVELAPGEPEQVLPALVQRWGAGLLVMGAYGHSRIRHLMVGSTTTTLLRRSEVAVLILR